MSREIELKFRIPPARLAALRRAVATRSAHTVALAARYFDTAAQDLARGRAALRLRLEGDTWVQTLKAEGAGPLQRLEHEVVLPAGAEPALDLRRHDGSAAGAVLARLLAAAGDAPLQERYATRVQRTQRLLRHDGALIELALDEGELSANGGASVLPILELELELKRGEPSALLALAQRWAQRFGLVLDMRSKSERGHLLALGRAHSAPAKARPLVLDAAATLGTARAAMVANTLQQVLANASVLADHGGPTGEPGHLHQLRVGLRRLRTVLALLPPAPDGWSVDQRAALAALFRATGQARDDDALAEGLWPALRAAGAPLLPPGPVTGGAAALVPLLASAPVQALWLALIGLSLPPGLAQAADAPLPEPMLAPALAAPLRHLWRQIRRDVRAFDELDEEARHRLRRRIKRLRYGLELSASLWPAGRVRRLRDALAAAQRPLGAYCDALVALARCQVQTADDGRAWFAVGWLSARRDVLLPECRQALRALAKARRAWPAAR